MANSSKKAEVVPVKKEQQAQRFTPKHLLTPFEDMERMFEEMMPSNWLRQHRMEWPFSSGMADVRTPKIDIIDRDNEVYVKAELPGIDKKDIDVSMTDNMITIKGSTHKEEKEEKGEYYRCEISQGAFSRSLALPAEVNIDKSEAKFKDGVLELVLPKMERAKRRNIKVE